MEIKRYLHTVMDKNLCVCVYVSWLIVNNNLSYLLFWTKLCLFPPCNMRLKFHFWFLRFVMKQIVFDFFNNATWKKKWNDAFVGWGMTLITTSGNTYTQNKIKNKNKDKKPCVWNYGFYKLCKFCGKNISKTFLN